MPLLYRLTQNTNSHSTAYGKYYAKAVQDGEVDIEKIADRMQAACTVKRADILAVLSELGPTITDLVQESGRVVLPYLGAFKLGISNQTGAVSADKWSVNSNVKNVHVIFQPECSVQVLSGKRKRIYAMCDGVTLKDIATLTPKASNSGGGSGQP